MYAQKHTHALTVYVHVCVVPEVNIGNLSIFSSSLLRWCLFLNPELTNLLDWLASKCWGSVCHPPTLSPRVTGMCYYAWIFKVGVGDLNPGFSARAGALVVNLKRDISTGGP